MGDLAELEQLLLLEEHLPQEVLVHHLLRRHVELQLVLEIRDEVLLGPEARKELLRHHASLLSTLKWRLLLHLSEIGPKHHFIWSWIRTLWIRLIKNLPLLLVLIFHYFNYNQPGRFVIKLLDFNLYLHILEIDLRLNCLLNPDIDQCARPASVLVYRENCNQPHGTCRCREIRTRAADVTEGSGVKDPDIGCTAADLSAPAGAVRLIAVLAIN